MANETADAGAPAPAPTVDAAKRRILVVDDQDTVREMLQIGLARNGYDVGCRSSPQAALAAVEADPGAFDLVITDQWMPDMAGIDLVRRMKRINPALRCVLATGFSDTVDAGTARAAGADAFVQKPIRVGDLVAIIEGLFDKNRA
jgi:DNA-binding NtrC family response regulator